MEEQVSAVESVESVESASVSARSGFRTKVLAGVVAIGSALPTMAFATEGSTTSSLSNITGAISTVMDLTSRVLGLITSEPFLCVFAASGLLSVGFTNWWRARRAAGG